MTSTHHNVESNLLELPHVSSREHLCRTIQCGTYTFQWGKTITEMDDSTDLLTQNDITSLRSRLANEGYVLLRNQLDLSLIDNALQIVTNALHKTWDYIQCNDGERTVNDLYVKRDCSGVLLTGYKPITHHQSVQSLLHCDRLIHLMNQIFNTEAVTYDTKWVRVKGTNEYTEEHSDFYRFSENSSNMLTMWMPLMDIPIEKGGLAMCPKSHLLQFERRGYGTEYKTMDELPPGFDKFNENAMWKTIDFKKGDVLIFDIRTVHASLVNQTNRFRISIDTRWQPRESVPFWSESFIRFKQDVEADENELNDMMMDCSISDEDSDNDVVQNLDFEEIANRNRNKTRNHGLLMD